MAKAVVLDANVLAKLVVEEHGSDIARRVFNAQELMFYVPSHALAEVFEVVCRATRGADQQRQQILETLVWLPGSVVVVPIETLLDKAVELNLNFQASIYDSLYVALAMERGIPLVTADERLARKFASSPVRASIILLAGAHRWIESGFPEPGVE